MTRELFATNFRIRPFAIDDERANLPEGVEDAYTFHIEASNLNLDAYYTHMTRKTLTAFARGAADGVQFLDSHNSRNLGYGRSFGGRVKVDSERQPRFDVPDGVELAIQPPSQYAYALLDIYTVPGINFAGGLSYASTDDFIRAVNSGLAADVSVGFYGGLWRCDICGNDYRDYRACTHFAGRIYPAGDSGERRVLSTVSIDGAQLAEVSAVYDGATPNASILKARSMAQGGKLDRDTKEFLEVRYQLDIPRGRIFPATWYTENENTQEERIMDYEKIVQDIRSVLAETGADETLEAVEQVRWLAAQVRDLAPLADDGRTYRADLITAALAEGVRAFGQDFNQEQYKALLERSGLNEIKLMTNDWRGIAAKRWPAGRQSNDASETTPQERPSLVPDSAYAA